MTGRVAREVGKTKPHSRTFEVSEGLLERWRDDPDHWSEPVQFRFEHNTWGWDLVMRDHKSAGKP